MICAPSRSACFSKSRLYFRSSVPSPNWLPCAIAEPAAPPTDGAADDAGNLAELQPGILRLRRIGRSMPQQHVRQLVRHDADDLAFGCRGVEHAAVDEHRPPGSAKALISFRFTGVNEYS